MVKKTMAKIRERFYWMDCKENVRESCGWCEIFVIGNWPLGRRKAPIRYNAGSPFERIAIDIVDSFPDTNSGNKYIFVKMVYFSK